MQIYVSSRSYAGLKTFFCAIFFGLFFGNSIIAQPMLVDNSLYKVELFADFNSIDPDLDAFHLTITEGENGFPAGMYVTPGPSFFPGGDKLIHIDPSGNINIVKSGLNSAEAMVFARGAYGDGILIGEPRDLRIQRLLSDGTFTTFANNLSSPPFGPPCFTYGSDGLLYATDGSIGSDNIPSRDILKIFPDGSTTVFATVPSSLIPSCTGTCFLHRMKAISPGSLNISSGTWQEDGFIVGTFALDSGGPTMMDGLYSISADGTTISTLIDSLSGLELIEFGPGGEFGNDLYVATEGGTATADGALYTLAPDGSLTTVMTNIDAIHATFDTQGVFGGGMFVADGTNGAGPGKIWRISRKTPIPTVSEWGMILLALLSLSIGLIFIKKRNYVLAMANSASFQGNVSIFDKERYKKTLAVVLSITLVGLFLSKLWYGSLTLTDTVGAILCSFVAAYLVHLLKNDAFFTEG